jgi:hypothetical protein
MSRQLFKPPANLIKEWPEVFDELYINTMPILYLKSLRLEFDGGRIWEIDVCSQLKESPSDIVIEKLLETFDEYKDEITKIDFSIDVDKLKSDIQKETKDLL